MDQAEERTKAKAAGGDWLILYTYHLKVVTQPLTFEEYRQKRGEWEECLEGDREKAESKLRKLENVLGI